MAEDYCDMCDLPLSTCIHGMPAPPPTPAAAPAARRTPRATATPKRVVQTSKPAPVRKRTEQETFRPYIVRLLQDEGSLETAEVMVHLEELMSEVLLERDRQMSPTGEIRWHTVARSERKAMMDEGLIVPAQPGIWQLTEAGKAVHL